MAAAYEMRMTGVNDGDNCIAWYHLIIYSNTYNTGVAAHLCFCSRCILQISSWKKYWMNAAIWHWMGSKSVAGACAREIATHNACACMLPDYIVYRDLMMWHPTVSSSFILPLSVIKSLWADVVTVLLEDARMQSSDHMYEGKKRRCLR